MWAKTPIFLTLVFVACLASKKIVFLSFQPQQFLQNSNVIWFIQYSSLKILL